MAKPQAVKLHKYTITPFQGNWLRFWNPFVRRSLRFLRISCVESERAHPWAAATPPKVYNRAKILEMNFGKDIRAHKALIKYLEALTKIASVHKVKEIQEFYTQSYKTV